MFDCGSENRRVELGKRKDIKKQLGNNSFPRASSRTRQSLKLNGLRYVVVLLTHSNMGRNVLLLLLRRSRVNTLAQSLV
jgi:hypothetical protein